MAALDENSETVTPHTTTGHTAGPAQAPLPIPAPAPGGAELRPATAQIRQGLLLLKDATVRIGGSLDLTEIACGLAETLVPALADRAAVYLLEALFEDHRLDTRLPDPAEEPFPALRPAAVAAPGISGAAGIAGIAGDTAAPGAAAATATALHTAMTTGEAVCTRAHTARSHQDGEPADATLVLPLQARGRTLGALVLSRRAGRMPYDEVDALLVRQLAVQAALSVDNAHLYRTEAVIADALQRSMLPSKLPAPAGVELAHRYLPAGHSAQVGGDWFDVIPLPGSRVALVVGDVMGHGISSAATMGRFRTAVRTLAALDLPPDQVLRHLDDLARELDDTCLATCIYVVYDPVTRRCTIANAGHIPPVLVHPDGRAELLTVPTGAPIGVGGVAFETIEVATVDGQVLVLCTDGLVEVRGQDIRSGLAVLCENLTAPGLPLDARCESLLKALHTEDRQDDVAVLMAQLQGIPAGAVAQWLLQPKPSTPARVRRLVRATLTGWGLDDCCEVTELLAGELVTNAVRHATRPIGVRLLRTDALLCEVTDNDHHLPVLRHAGDDDETGRGLQLVSRMARRWGVSRTAGGKVVWFEHALGTDQADCCT